MLQLFTDTDTDIDPQVAQRYGYCLISMPYSIDGETVYPYEDFDTYDDHAFYDLLRGGAMPSTSAISEERYRQYFEPVFAAGDDILYVHFSRAMTATFDNMDRAVAALLKQYPDRHFYAVDTKGITIVSYAIVCEIGEMVAAGKTPQEILDWAKDEVDHYAVYFFANDLKFFKKSGRVSGLTAMMGTVIGVRPIICMDAEGKMVSVGTERGRVRALERLIGTVEELGDAVADHRVIVGHTDAPEAAAELETMLREKFGADLDVTIVPVNPTAGSHCGPDIAGICFHAKHR